MRYAEPKTTTLSVTNNGTTYTKEVYKTPTTLTGITDESHPDYDQSVTYNIGDYVIVPELKTIYRCAADGVSGVFPPNDPTKWVDYGFVNSYRMLSTDEQIGSQSEGVDVYMEFDFSRSTTLALLNTEFDSVTIEQIDNASGDVVGSKTIDGTIFAAQSFSEYFFGEEEFVTRIIIDDLLWLANSTLKITFTGNVKIGTIVMGRSRDLGCTLYGSTLTFRDRSKIQTDEITGFRKVVRYGHIRVLDAQISISIGEFNLVSQKISKIIGKNVLWIPTKEDKFGEMTNIAYIEEVPLPVENPKIIKTNITLIGVM